MAALIWCVEKLAFFLAHSEHIYISVKILLGKEQK